MLYKKNKSKELDMNLFKNPTSEYRGAPFWAWNTKLEKDVLLRQVDAFKDMGFGGFNIHSRSGLATEYMGKEFMQLVRDCHDKAKDIGLLTWLYDEDRWSSGFGGGRVTKNWSYRQKMMCWCDHKVEGAVSKEEGIKENKLYFLTAFDIQLDKDGYLVSYKTLGEDEPAQYRKEYVYVKCAPSGSWFDGQSYVDNLSKDAIKEFINVTHEVYKDTVGDGFGDTVPAIFTDEPWTFRKDPLKKSLVHEDIIYPWTYDFDESYKKAYDGEDIVAKLPEIFWEMPGGEISPVRYRYHDHVCERFNESYADQLGEWCENNNIALTGHLRDEPTLYSQTWALGEAMRAYRSFQIPGMDLLCDAVELTTAKQVQSCVHQYAREAMLSELYGVTNWDFDFRGHKFQGDWQAALGVSVRVPHLSWVSMKGCAKRDYPASINYQSPWYKDYPYVEDHYARLNTVLTRGTPAVNVGVIHPIETYWINFGPNDKTAEKRQLLDSNFQNLTKWLITDMVDFDFISESLLPSQYKESTDALCVGAMSYKTVIVPGCETLRRSTFEILKKFKENGGRIVFMGDCPKYLDAIKSDEVKALYDACETIPFDMVELSNALENEKSAKIIQENGKPSRNFAHNVRLDGDVKWMFFAHCVKNGVDAIHYDKRRVIDLADQEVLTFVIDGEYIPEVYNTVSGEVEKVDFETKNGKTYIYKTLFMHDSLLLKLTKGQGSYFEEKKEKSVLKTYRFFDGVEYSREEDNVYVLDLAEYKLNDEGEFCEKDEILRIDETLRKVKGFPMASGDGLQPWLIDEEVIENFVTLKFDVECTDKIKNIEIAGEGAKEIRINGKKIDLKPCGYYVDESIVKYKAGTLKKGHNEIIIVAPFGPRTSIENYFILGDFDVNVSGCKAIISEKSDKIGFGSLSQQGLAFYGGNITYKMEIDTPECDLFVRTSRYRGHATKVYLDGKLCGYIAYAPYEMTIKDVSKGKHTLEIVVLGNRVNTFGPLHNAAASENFAPWIWYTYKPATPWQKTYYDRTEMPQWSYEYMLSDTGILSSPLVQAIEKK